MLRPTSRRPRARRGAILLVVLALLALFAVIGLSFALYAESEATAARIHRESTVREPEEVPDGTDGVNFFLGQLIYPIDPGSEDIRSPLYGYSLAETAWGYRWFDPRYNQLAAPNNTPANQAFAPNRNLSLYAGTGKLTGQVGIPGAGAVNRSDIINFSLFQNPSAPQFDYVIDPAWQEDLGPGPKAIRTRGVFGATTSPASRNFYRFRPGDPLIPIRQVGATYQPDTTLGVGANPFANFTYTNIAAPYTYPDLKDLYLAVQNPETGEILQPSFHRGYLFDQPTNQQLGSTLTPPAGTGQLIPPGHFPNTNWNSADGRLRILRPRPIEHLFDSGDGRGAVSDFPYPPPNPDGTYTGDLLNLTYHQGRQKNDSIWLFPGLPNGQVRKWRGKEYAVLVAPLILDLNGRVHLGVSGNAKGPGNTHASARGLGPWEINPRRILELADSGRTYGAADKESTIALRSLLFGYPAPPSPSSFPTPTGGVGVVGRYSQSTGAATAVAPPNDRLTGLTQILFNGGQTPRPYAKLDLDGATTSAAAGDRVNPVGASGAFPFPAFNTTPGSNRYGPNEINNHPAQFTPEFATMTGVNPTGSPFGTNLPGRKFDYADLRRIAARYAERPDVYARSDVSRLAPHALIAGGARFDGATLPNTNPRLSTATTGPTAGLPNAAVNGPFLFGRSDPGNPVFNQPANPSVARYNPDTYQFAKDPAHSIRQLVTTHSSTVFRPELTLELPVAGTTQTFRFGPIDLNRPLADYILRTTPDNDPTNPLSAPYLDKGWSPDGLFFTRVDDPNDPTDTVGQLNANKIAQYQRARVARQNFARDVMVRLVLTAHRYVRAEQQRLGLPQTGVVDGVNITYDSVNGYFVPAPGGNTADALAKLRMYAQLAANVVDYIDNDEIATVFLFHPYQGGTYFDPMAAAWPVIPPGSEGNVMVVGSELPRLTVSEAYAALVNDRMTPQMRIRVQFWIELQNPVPYLGATNPLAQAELRQPGNGAARLHYKAGVGQLGMQYFPATFSPYRLTVWQSTPALATNLTDPTNVFGKVAGSAAVDDNGARVLFGQNNVDHYDYTATGPPGAGKNDFPPGSEDYHAVTPRNPLNNSGYAPPRRNEWYYTLGPGDDFPGQDTGTNAVQKYNQWKNMPGNWPPPTTPPAPPVMPAPADAAAGATIRTVDGQPSRPPGSPPEQSLYIDAGDATDPNIMMQRGQNYAVVLRRLANPYLPEQTNPNAPNYNPYVTVDVFDGVTPRDRVTQNASGMRNPGGTGPNGEVQDPSRGRRHTYAAATVLDQQHDPTAMPAPQPPGCTWYEPNTTDANPANAWLTHLDRQLINALELAAVSAVPSHLLTTRFATGAGAGPFQFHQHTAAALFLPGLQTGLRTFQLDANPPTGITPAINLITSIPTPTDINPPAGSQQQWQEGALVKALEVMSTHSPTGTTPVGGREHGRINVNTAWHRAVFQALFDAKATGDPTAPNYFSDQDVFTPQTTTPAGTNNSIWYRLNRSSQAAPAGDAAAVDGLRSRAKADSYNVTATDTPFQGMDGVAYGRYNSAGVPHAFYHPSPATSGAGDVTHPSVVTEPLGKMWNNASTTSDQFLVIMTVGFFEVRGRDAATGRVYLGKEMQKDIPGDLRQKYVAVVDRTNLGLPSQVPEPTGPQVALDSIQSGFTPWFTTLASDIPPSPRGAFETPPRPNATAMSSFPIRPVVNEFPIGAMADPPPGSVTVVVRGQYILPATAGPGATPRVRIPVPDGGSIEIPARIGTANGHNFTISAGDRSPYQAAGDPNTLQPYRIRIGFGDATRNNAGGEEFDVIGIGPYPRQYYPAGAGPYPAWASGTNGLAELVLVPAGSLARNPGDVTPHGRHSSGSPVSNVLLGNPGPQASFEAFRAGRYRGTVVPYLVKLAPGS